MPCNIIIFLIQKAVGPILNSLFPCERLSGVADPCARVRVSNVRILYITYVLMNVTYNTVLYSNYLELQKLRNYLSSRTLAVKKPKLIRVYTSLIVCACHLVFVCTVLSCLCYLI